ncbi:MAG TPA: T9SS type A sorting domain-containing protein [Puia sp.]
MLSGDVRSGHLQIFDMTGKMLYQKDIQSQAILDLSTLPKGLYIVKFFTGTKTLSKKMLIE